jgi:hypothetical protein
MEGAIILCKLNKSLLESSHQLVYIGKKVCLLFDFLIWLTVFYYSYKYIDQSFHISHMVSYLYNCYLT